MDSGRSQSNAKHRQTFKRPLSYYTSLIGYQACIANHCISQLQQHDVQNSSAKRPISVNSSPQAYTYVPETECKSVRSIG